MARELESFKSINIVLYAILAILENSDFSVILVLSVIVDILDMITAI